VRKCHALKTCRSRDSSHLLESDNHSASPSTMCVHYFSEYYAGLSSSAAWPFYILCSVERLVIQVPRLDTANWLVNKDRHLYIFYIALAKFESTRKIKHVSNGTN